MIHKLFHNTYIVNTDELLRNFDYILKYNDKAKQSITVKKGNKVIALLLPSEAVVEFEKAIEKLEEQHQLDHQAKKALEKRLATLEARLELLNNNEDDLPFK